MAVRSDIVLRSEKYTETGNRYNWRWEWIDSDVDFTDAKKKKLLNPKYPDKVRLGQWIRKIRSSGKAYCTLCQKENASRYYSYGISFDFETLCSKHL